MEKVELLEYLLEQTKYNNGRDHNLFWKLLYAIKDVDEGRIPEKFWKAVVGKLKREVRPVEKQYNMLIDNEFVCLKRTQLLTHE
ncbi:MAG: hypothetical protein H7329_08610 [Opitutaceae bacterium]|nr:hypothetical protein [Cytophagales bacterium]